MYVKNTCEDVSGITYMRFGGQYRIAGRVQVAREVLFQIGQEMLKQPGNRHNLGDWVEYFCSAAQTERKVRNKISARLTA